MNDDYPAMVEAYQHEGITTLSSNQGSEEYIKSDTTAEDVIGHVQ